VFAALVLALVFITATPGWALEPYSIEPAHLNPKDPLPRALVDKLDSQGWLLFTETHGLKAPICEVFWVKAASVQEGQPGSKARYGGLETGTLLGVIHFLPETDKDFREDFHDQKLAPGYYSMRYAQRPQSEPADVLMLSPVNADREAESVLSAAELSRRSRLASRTAEPAVLSLVSPELRKEEVPTLRMDEEGTCIFQVQLRGKAGAGSPRDTAVAVILVTPRKGEGDES